MPKITFVNEQTTVEVRPGETVLQAAERVHINVFRGLFQGLHCRRVQGWCGRCKVWATPLATGGLNDKTGAERRSVGQHGTTRLACQALVTGDVEVRTRAGFVIAPTVEWQVDPRQSKWRDRWEHRNDEPSEDEKPKAKAKAAAAAKPPAKPAAAAAAVVVAEAKPAAIAATTEGTPAAEAAPASDASPAKASETASAGSSVEKPVPGDAAAAAVRDTAALGGEAEVAAKIEAE